MTVEGMASIAAELIQFSHIVSFYIVFVLPEGIMCLKNTPFLFFLNNSVKKLILIIFNIQHPEET